MQPPEHFHFFKVKMLQPTLPPGAMPLAMICPGVFMHRYYSIKRRLFAAVLGLLLLLLAPSGLYIAHSLRADAQREMLGTAESVLRAVEWSLASHEAFDGFADLHAWAEGYEATTGIRLSYIVNGKLAADSSMDYASVPFAPDHSLRPEIVQAQQEGLGIAVRQSTTANKRFVYAAMPADSIMGVPFGVLRIAVPDASVVERLRTLSYTLVSVFAGAFALGALLIWALFWSMFRHFDAMAVSAQEIGFGDYSRRMPDVRCLELAPFVEAINGMAHNIEVQIREISEDRSQLLVVLNGMREGVMLLDADGRVRLFNPAAAAIFPGLSQMKGELLMQATMQPRLHEAVARILADPDAASTSLRLNLPGDAVFEASLIPLPQGGAARLVLVFTDVSEQERVDRIRRDFVANVSHELRTPLTSIQGYAESLRDTQDLPLAQRTQFLDVIIRNTEHMTRMTDSLLNLARTEHAAASRKLEPVDAAAVLHQVAHELQPVLQDRGADLALRLPVGALPVLAEKGGLHEVFRNLLENAAKYGGGRIEVYCAQEDGMTVFLLRDYGQGIPKESRERVFERFFRLERGTGHEKGSVGLGLAICRHIMRNMQGSIRIEDPADGGAGVVFAVRLKKASA